MNSILKKHTILYVEDEPQIQANIAEYLGNYFAEVYLAPDGKTAIEHYNKFHPDVLLLDINLPQIDGLSVAQQIRQHDQTIKIIMLTAFSEKDKLLKATELKLTKYLIKPVTPNVFKDTLSILSDELFNNPSRFINLYDHLSWDKQDEILTHRGELIHLSEKEHRLLKYFVSHKGKVVRYEKIIEVVWGDVFDRDISIDSVKNQVSQLRKKTHGADIVSVYGEGYVLK